MMETTPAVVRHGPQVTDDQLRTWLATGIAPDGQEESTRQALRFASYEDIVHTREIALKSFEGRLLLDLAKPHPAGYTRAEAILPYRQPIGDGWRGRDGSQDPARPGCWTEQEPIPPDEVRFVRTVLVWSGDRWSVAEHVPSLGPAALWQLSYAVMHARRTVMPPPLDASAPSSVRYFVTLGLWSGEEVPADLVPWLEQWATVDFVYGRPLTGVWQTKDGRRRVCWYSERPAAELRVTHRDRYGDEAFWVVALDTDDQGQRRASVQECDAEANLIVRREWTFDMFGMPSSQREYSRTGELVCERAYECRSDGAVLKATERQPPSFDAAPIDLPPRAQVEDTRTIDLGLRPRFPELCAELSAEPFPCGSTLRNGAVRIVAPISANDYQGRYRSVAWSGNAWSPCVTTIAQVSPGKLQDIQPVLDLEDPHLAKKLAQGPLEHSRAPRVASLFMGIAEEIPLGTTLEEIVDASPLSARDAARIALQVGKVARRAVDLGPRQTQHIAFGPLRFRYDLMGIRPELIYVQRGPAGLDVVAVMHRGPVLLWTTSHGEMVLFPPPFLRNFSGGDDIASLRNLLWYMTTGEYRGYARGDEHWTAGVDPRTRPWNGPSKLRDIVEPSLSYEEWERLTLSEFLEQLERVAVKLKSV